MNLTRALATLGYNVAKLLPVSGGMINTAMRVVTSDGDVFIKWNNAASPGLFEAEADGLRALAATRTLRVPQVLHVAARAGETPAFLVLEWLEPASGAPEDFARGFARDLAALHRAPVEDSFGWPRDNFLGALPQINTPRPSWPIFYRDCRLLPQIEIARRQGLLPRQRESLLWRVVEKLELLLGDFSPSASLLHGDLWSGNFLVTQRCAAVVDPAVYRGEREMEIAFVELFGGFPPDFVALYAAEFPLQAGYTRRRPLHQLYPLLIHLNHFGESYGADVERACRDALHLA